MTKARVYVTRALLPEAFTLLRSRCHVDVGPENGLRGEDFVEALRGADAVIATSVRLGPEALDALASPARLFAATG